MAHPEFHHILRPEAGPVSYRALHHSQQEALRRIVQALKAGAGIASPATSDSGSGGDHASRIFFVSGEPGSGKSTLYITLKDVLSEESTSRLPAKTFEEYDVELPGVQALRRSVRWLEPIDLEVAGNEHENLLAAVLVRIIAAMTELDENRSVLGASKPCHEAYNRLDELASDIGVAWEGNLQDRAGALDPDTYSMEVMRAQRARLGVNRRLHEALDTFARHGCGRCPSNVLFVLPIDDFYLKPAASLELLRLLRMISVPRLFFLVMGDIKTVEALFFEKALADWTSVAGAEIFRALPSRHDEVLARARELRARYLRKLLPPKQRAVIKVMDWHEAIEFSPERLGDKTGHGELPPLRSLLAEVKLPPPSNSNGYPENFLDFLIWPRWVSGLSAQSGTLRYQEAYTALQLLDATPREIMDLWLALDEVASKVKLQTRLDISPLIMQVVESVNMAIEEQDFLGEENQEKLRTVLGSRSYSEDLRLDMRPLYLEPECGQWRSSTSRTVCVRKHVAWRLGVYGVGGRRRLTDTAGNSKGGGMRAAGIREYSDRAPYSELPPRPTAWIVLLNDLVSLWKPESFISHSLVQDVRNRLQEDQGSKPDGPCGLDQGGLGWAFLILENSARHFPMPGFETLRDLDQFLNVWSRGLDAKNTLQEFDQFIELWAIAGWTVMDRRYEEFAARTDEGWFDRRPLRVADFKEAHRQDLNIKKWIAEISQFKETTARKGHRKVRR